MSKFRFLIPSKIDTWREAETSRLLCTCIGLLNHWNAIRTCFTLDLPSKVLDKLAFLIQIEHKCSKSFLPFETCNSLHSFFSPLLRNVLTAESWPRPLASLLCDAINLKELRSVRLQLSASVVIVLSLFSFSWIIHFIWCSVP